MNPIRISADASIDLQLHTVYSDGTWTPEQLIDYLCAEQFALAAITDHDRVDTLISLQELAREKDFPLLVAVEMTTRWRGEYIDMLCFGFDPTHNELQALTENMLRQQQDNIRQTAATMAAQGLVIPEEDIQRVIAMPVAPMPLAFFELVKKSGVETAERSAGRFAQDCGLEQIVMDSGTVVEAAHRSGGVCLIAHPGRGDGYLKFDEAAFDQLRAEIPIDGFEVHYPKHTQEQIAMFRAYADKHHLLTSAGSDSHTPEKPPIKYPAHTCRLLLERVGIILHE